MIVGICGAARSVKDIVANMLLVNWVQTNLEIPPVKRIQVAGPLKQFCREVFDWTLEHTDGDLKDVEDERYKRDCPVCTIPWTDLKVDDTPARPGQVITGIEAEGYSFVPTGWQPCDKCDGRGFTFLKPREAMQRLGYDWSYPLYLTIWADKAARTAREFVQDHDDRLAIVTDCRFVADIQAVANAGGIVIQVHEGLTGAAAEPKGETVRNSAGFQAIVHHHIYNDGTLDDLQDKVTVLLEQLRKEAAMR